MQLLERIKGCLGGLIIDISEFHGDIAVEVDRFKIVEALTRLRDDESLSMNFLSDLFGLDNKAFYEKPKKKAKKGDAEGEEEEKPKELPPRFEVVYLLLSLKTNERMMVKIRVPEDDLEVSSVTSLYKAATWPEREAFDMFGIRFKGHPNLKRLLMWDDFPAYPLRKDYPLEGRGEERSLVYGD